MLFRKIKGGCNVVEVELLIRMTTMKLELKGVLGDLLAVGRLPE